MVNFDSMRRITVLFLALALAGVLAWQSSSILKIVPARYRAYLPEPLQALAVRDRVAVLPTAAAAVDADILIQADLVATATPITTLPQPAIQTEAAQPAASPTPAFTPTSTPTPTATPLPAPPAARLQGVQHQFQLFNNCGPATLAMTLSYFDVFVTQSDTAAFLKPNPDDPNVSPAEMAAYVNEKTAFAAIARANGSLDTLRRLLAYGFPVIVEVGLDPPNEFAWNGWYGHYLLVVAYDDTLQQVWVYDSWFGTSEVPFENASPDGRVITYDFLDTYWRQFNRSYVALYNPANEATLAAVIGSDINDSIMWQHSLANTQSEAAAEPGNAFLWFNLGASLTSLEQYQEAAAAFDQARSIGLPFRTLWYQFYPYEAYYQVGRFEDMIQLADVTLDDARFVLNEPYFEETFYYKALALDALGHQDEARENYERAIASNPTFTPAAEALEALQSGG